jgi:hypothetical protein
LKDFQAGFSGEIYQLETTISGATSTSLLPNKTRSFTFNNTSKEGCSMGRKL